MTLSWISLFHINWWCDWEWWQVSDALARSHIGHRGWCQPVVAMRWPHLKILTTALKLFFFNKKTWYKHWNLRQRSDWLIKGCCEFPSVQATPSETTVKLSQPVSRRSRCQLWHFLKSVQCSVKILNLNITYLDMQILQWRLWLTTETKEKIAVLFLSCLVLTLVLIKD